RIRRDDEWRGLPGRPRVGGGTENSRRVVGTGGEGGPARDPRAGGTTDIVAGADWALRASDIRHGGHVPGEGSAGPIRHSAEPSGSGAARAQGPLRLPEQVRKRHYSAGERRRNGGGSERPRSDGVRLPT